MKLARDQQDIVDRWNGTHAVDEPVTVTMDSGEVRETTTRGRAFLSSSGHPVIMLDCVSGFYLLSRVRAVA